MDAKTIKRFLKNKKGIETRVLIYVLAAIALVVAISIVGKVNTDAGTMVDDAMKQAKDAMPKTDGSSDPTSTLKAEGEACTSGDECKSGLVCTANSAGTKVCTAT